MMRKIMLVLLVFCILCLPCAALCTTAQSALPETGFEGLCFSEILASNQGSYITPYETTPDWVELENTTDSDMDLAGLWLTDSKKVLNKFIFPQGTIIKAHGFLVIFASGFNGEVAGDLHAAFKLSADGESVALYANGVRVDSLSFDVQEPDVSFARNENGLFTYTTTPTPGAANVFTGAGEEP